MARAMNADSYFSPSTLFEELSCADNRWALRMTALASLPQHQRCCDFEAAPDFSKAVIELESRPKRHISVDRFLERAVPSVAATYRALLVIAAQVATVEDVVELAARARKELSSGTALKSTYSAYSDLLLAHPILDAAVQAHFDSSDDDTESSSLVALCALSESVDFMRPLAPLCADSVACLVQHLQGAFAARGSILSEARKRYGVRSEIRAVVEWNAASAPEDAIVSSGGTANPIEKIWFPGAHLRGRPDGYFASTGELVEIKFRTKNFCSGGLLRDSERLQVHAYMFMTGIPRCTLLEGIGRRGSMLLRHTQVIFDAVYWKEITYRAMKLVEFRKQIGSHDWFRSAFFAMSNENQARMVESVIRVEPERPEVVSTLKRGREADENDEVTCWTKEDL